MSEPLMSRAAAQPADLMLEQSSGWDDPLLTGLFAPARVKDPFEPAGEVKKTLALLMGQKPTRDVIEWLLDLTLRAPYPHIAGDFESAALAAAKHQARAAVGECLVAAIVAGNKLLNSQGSDQ